MLDTYEKLIKTLEGQAKETSEVLSTRK